MKIYFGQLARLASASHRLHLSQDLTTSDLSIISAFMSMALVMLTLTVIRNACHLIILTPGVIAARRMPGLNCWGTISSGMQPTAETVMPTLRWMREKTVMVTILLTVALKI